MSRTRTGTIDQQERRRRLNEAAAAAREVVMRLELNQAPVDPVAVARTERPQLRLCPGDYRDAFDGRLELRDNRFYCYYNTKYDEPAQGHAPRTRFSLAHELGHYFIESHHQHLRRGGRPHPSQLGVAAPARKVLVEAQANKFAADLLMPPHLFVPLATREDVTIGLVEALAERFDTSTVSTACQLVQHSDACVAAGIVHDGELAWVWPSQALVSRGLYPDRRKNGQPHSAGTRAAWNECCRGCTVFASREGRAGNWFNTYGKCDDLPVVEHFARVEPIGELLVLVVVPDNPVLMHGDWY